MLAGWLMLACVFAETCRAAAQAQTQAQAASSESAAERRAKTVFSGQIAIPYEVECGGLKLAAGQYAIAVTRQGKTQMVVFSRAGYSVQVPAKTVFPSERRGGSIVMVRRHGVERRIEAVHVEKLRLVLYLDSEQALETSNGEAQMERLPIT